VEDNNFKLAKFKNVESKVKPMMGQSNQKWWFIHTYQYICTSLNTLKLSANGVIRLLLWLNLLLFLKARPSKAQPHLPDWCLVVLQLAHCQQTFVKISKLHETHPFVFAVLFPLHFTDNTADSLTQFSNLLLLFGLHHSHEEYVWRRIKIRYSPQSFASILMFLLILCDFFHN